MKKLLIILTVLMLISCRNLVYYDYDYTIDVTFNNGIEKQIHYKCHSVSGARLSLKSKQKKSYLVAYVGQGTFYIASDVLYFSVVDIQKTIVIETKTTEE